MKIIDLDEKERPREKLLERGAAGLSNGELLAILLRGGTRTESALDLSRTLLSSAGGSLCALFNTGAQKLLRVPGIGPCKAAGILAAFELGRRFLQEESGLSGRPIVSARMVYNLMIPVLKGLDHEECWVLFVNVRHCETGRMRVSAGGPVSTTLDPGQIARAALERGAWGIILIHNHPTGDPMPSQADIRQTEILKAAMNAIDVSLVDHVVISDRSFFSFEQGTRSIA